MWMPPYYKTDYRKSQQDSIRVAPSHSPDVLITSHDDDKVC